MAVETKMTLPYGISLWQKTNPLEMNCAEIWEEKQN